MALSAESTAAQQPQYQAGPAIGSGVVQPGENRSRHFAPPVHIAPGSATALPTDTRSMQPNRKRGIVQNGYEQPPQPGLQDRLSQAFRRKEPTEVSRTEYARSSTAQSSHSPSDSTDLQAPAARNQSQVQRAQRQRVASNERRYQELTATEEQSLETQRTFQQAAPRERPQPNPMVEHSYSVQEPEMPQLADRSEFAPATRRQNSQAQQTGSSRAVEILDQSISRVTAMDNKATGRKNQPEQIRQAVMQEVDSGDFNWSDGAAPQNTRPAISNNNTPKQSPSSFRQSSILSRTSEEFDARRVQDQDDLGTFRPKPESRNQQDLQSLKDELKSLEPSPSQDDGFQPLPKPEEKQEDRANDLNDELENLERDPRSLLDREEGMKDDSDDGDQDEDKPKKTLLDKGCEEFRNDLLNTNIRDIALDISPPSINVENQLMSISRSWTDRSGNIIATGTMLDMRRGYVILDNGQKISFARLSEADLAAVSEHWNMPRTCLVAQRGSVERCWTPQRFTWTAASLCHKPLYFENIQLERYGHTHGPVMQPIRSVGHFFVSLATLPYHTAIHPANECQYPLGLYRPGDCAPWLKDPIPISLDGIRRQGLVTTGLAFIP